MNNQQSAVLTNMQIIQSTFSEVQEVFGELDKENTLVARLTSYPVQFRSIAYEAASMCMALSGLQQGNQLNRWVEFREKYVTGHATQYHIGLGWALAQQQLSSFNFTAFTDAAFSHKVYDGYGYYEGLFRRRKSILQQEPPVFIEKDAAYNYDCGLGRCVWYDVKGDIGMAVKVIAAFADERKPALYTGLGVAIAYVGGCSKEMLEEISTLVTAHKGNLLAGAQMALASRKQALSVTDDVLFAVDAFS